MLDWSVALNSAIISQKFGAKSHLFGSTKKSFSPRAAFLELFWDHPIFEYFPRKPTWKYMKPENHHLWRKNIIFQNLHDFWGSHFRPGFFLGGGESRRSPNLDTRNCDLVYWDHIFLGFPHDFHIQMSQSKLNGCVFRQQEMAHCGRCSERTNPHQLGFTHDDSSA